MSATTAIDPITLAVVRNYLNATAVEMRDTIQRTSFSPVIYEDRDFACGLLDGNGGTLAEAPGLTLFMGTLSPGVIKSMPLIGRENIEPGDIFITSMPEFTGSHPADMMLFAPIFHSGKIFAFAASKAHLIDVGAKDPYPTDSIDAFQEGLRLPPLKLYSRGEIVSTLETVIKSNSRAPEVIWGDIQSQIACFRVAEKACIRLLDKYGFDTVTACVQEIYDHAERMARAAIRAMPAGTWSASDHLDDNGVERGVNVPVTVKVTIRPEQEEIEFDYTDSAPQQVGPTNAPTISTVSVSRMLGKILSAPGTPANEGSFRPIKVVTAETSVFNPASTAPTNLYGWPLLTAVETATKALAPVFPDKLPAQSGGDLCGIFRYGYWPESGKMFVEANIEGIGQGASSTSDGESAVVHVAEACSRNLPVEIEETHNPTIIERYELITDSGGAGTFRGGLGVRRDYRMHLPGFMISILERCTAPGEGVNGGKTAHATYGWVESSIHGNIRIEKTPATPFAAGDLISIRTGGGGGWGDPLLRDPQAVLRDVKDGYVSLDSAHNDYGVVIDPETLELDEPATHSLRASA
ncbi:MAG: hydantoinase B/oxoprolinase family protein [Thermomicrobiales bacterium]|nr:hydantoinase B/oxoprolinase family protein [Thermomicrobiales bacterium]